MILDTKEQILTAVKYRYITYHAAVMLLRQLKEVKNIKNHFI